MTHTQVGHTTHWVFAYDIRKDIAKLLPENKCGKWMHVFEEKDYAQIMDIVIKSVDEDACSEAKLSSAYNMSMYDGTGVACFYIDGTKPEQHKRILQFMLNNNLFPYDDNGHLKDAPFKFDWQTRAGQYDDTFVPEIKLSDFVNLDTGVIF